MSTERKKVLELLAQGKITTEEAEKLLNKLDALSGSPPEPANSASESKPTEGKPLRYLRVEVAKPGSVDNVNVRIPLSFLRASAGLHVLLPQHVQEKLSTHGIDIGSLSRLRGQELEKVLQQLDVHVEESGGKKVHIFCE